MAKICLCLTAKTLERNMEILEKNRKYVDMAELRVDCLDPDERLLIRSFPYKTDVPVILAIRRGVDGGHFSGGEGARINLMARGLAYADTDRRRNFAWLDIEEDLNVPSLEEAARTFGTKIIRSFHNISGTGTGLSAKIRSMRHSGDEIAKVAVTAHSTNDVLELLRAGRECADIEKILIAMGHYGVYSRILAEQFGSCLSYTSALSEPDAPTAAPGQIGVEEMANLYRFRSIDADTCIFGVTGFPLKVTGSPRFFNTVFGEEDMNAVYVPFPADSINACMEIARELNVRGFSVTVPYKEVVLPFLDSPSAELRTIGACNTLIRGDNDNSGDRHGWAGVNTDTRGFSDSLLCFMDRPNFRRLRATVIGAGGAARAIAYELHRLGAKALILNRTPHKARALATPYKFAWGSLDNQGIEMMDKYHDIIINTTIVGMEGYDREDPAAMYHFSGKETVMDLIYQPERTPFLKRAEASGCKVLNGYDMLIRQARYQYVQFTGREFPNYLVSRVQFGGT